MTQCPYPPPLADLDLFRHRPPLLMFARALETSVMTTGRKKMPEKKKLEKDKKTTDILANTIDLCHILLSPTFQ
jgi:hypothetical protein